MRILKSVLLVVGIALLGVLVHRVGTVAILQTLNRLTWWQFVVICLPYAAIMAVDTLGWRYAFARDRAPFRRLYRARVIGEALNIVTALGSVGGEAAKAWLVREDVSYEERVPSVRLAKATIAIAQAPFICLGIGLAWSALDVSAVSLRGTRWPLGSEVVAGAGSFGAQVSGPGARGGRVLKAFGVIDEIGGA